MKNKEIERKWIIKQFPSIIPPNEDWLVELFYIYVTDDFEQRVRKRVGISDPENISYKMTTKLGNGLIRDEVENQLTRKEYIKFLELNRWPPIKKRYHVYHIRGIEFQISRVDNEWCYMEVEFDSIEAAEAFNIEDFGDIFDLTTIHEETDNKAYAMKNYWRRTRLKGD